MRKIMLVDDSQLFYRFVKDMLKNEDIEIVWAKSGEEALKKYGEEKPELVLVDIILSDTNGVDIIRKLKDLDNKANIMVISGLDKGSVIKDALNAGARDYLVKNVSISYFKKKILENLP